MLADGVLGLAITQIVRGTDIHRTSSLHSLAQWSLQGTPPLLESSLRTHSLVVVVEVRSGTPTSRAHYAFALSVAARYQLAPSHWLCLCCCCWQNTDTCPISLLVALIREPGPISVFCGSVLSLSGGDHMPLASHDARPFPSPSDPSLPCGWAPDLELSWWDPFRLDASRLMPNPCCAGALAIHRRLSLAMCSYSAEEGLPHSPLAI